MFARDQILFILKCYKNIVANDKYASTHMIKGKTLWELIKIILKFFSSIFYPLTKKLFTMNRCWEMENKNMNIHG